MTVLAIADLREAQEPPEVLGRGRDDVAMLVSKRQDASLAHLSFRDLPRVDDVARKRDDARQPPDRTLELLAVAGIDDQAPAAPGEDADEREAEPARRAGDDSDRLGHAAPSGTQAWWAAQTDARAKPARPEVGADKRRLTRPRRPVRAARSHARS